MPFIRIETNVEIPAGKAEEILRKVNAAAAAASGKAESLFQLVLEGGKHMLLGGTAEPTAYVDYKGINQTADKTAPLSAAICQVLGETLGIPANRVYIPFTSFDAAMWGRS